MSLQFNLNVIEFLFFNLSADYTLKLNDNFYIIVILVIIKISIKVIKKLQLR